MKSWVGKLYYIPGGTLNTRAVKNVRRFSALLAHLKTPVLLNLGCGDRFIGQNGLSQSQLSGMIRVDLPSMPKLDVAADALAVPFRAEVFDGIICQAVLEHVTDPWKVRDEMFRILKKGGIVYAEVPFMQGYHADPHDYHRFTREGLDHLFAGFEKIEAGISVGPSSALSWILREYITGLLSGFSQRRRLRAAAQLLAGWMTFPLKYLDLLYSGRPGAHRIASGFYFIGRKP